MVVVQQQRITFSLLVGLALKISRDGASQLAWAACAGSAQSMVPARLVQLAGAAKEWHRESSGAVMVKREF